MLSSFGNLGGVMAKTAEKYWNWFLTNTLRPAQTNLRRTEGRLKSFMSSGYVNDSFGKELEEAHAQMEKITDTLLFLEKNPSAREELYKALEDVDPNASIYDIRLLVFETLRAMISSLGPKKQSYYKGLFNDSNERDW